MHAECAACGILKAERILNARLKKLIGALYLCSGINGAAPAVRLLLLL